jgi:subtilisin family serine protease
VPAGAVAAADGHHAARFVVGFDGEPAVHRGDDYHGGKVVNVHRALHFAVVEAADEASFRGAAASGADVRYLEPDPVQRLLALTPDDPSFGSQYGPQEIGAPAAWDTTTGASSTILCTVDTGVRSTHEDLAAGWAGGYDFVNGDADPTDDNGHGTHVTGIAAAAIGNAKGIAGIAGVSIKHAKVLDASGYGSWSNVASGITWCADHGAHVVSLSLGGSAGSTALQDAVRYAWAHGAVVVAAAGNSGPCSDCVLYPARYAEAIAVACVYSDKTLCTFSSGGPEVDLAAPGASILSSAYSGDTAYVRMSGTSMAAPHVAGAAALVVSAHPDWTNQMVRDALESTAEDVGEAGLDAGSGHGLVRADLALGATPPPPPPPPPQPDLVVSGLAWSPAQPLGGRPVTFTATVTNQGAAAAGSSYVHFLLDGTLLKAKSTPSLAAGAGASVSVSWRGVVGNHTLLARADATGRVAESDEANNERSSGVEVVPVVHSVSVASSASSQTVAPPSPANYTLTVTNLGNVPERVSLRVAGLHTGWRVALSAGSVLLPPGQAADVQMRVTGPDGQQLDLTVSARCRYASAAVPVSTLVQSAPG